MSEEDKVLCFKPNLNINRHLSPKEDTFNYTYICRDDEKILLKDLWEEHKQLKRLQAENERLKKEIRLYDCIDKWGTKQCHCACRCLGNEFCQDADKRINKYCKALEEIRSYVNTQLDGFGNDVYGITKNQITTITNKINEVLDD